MDTAFQDVFKRWRRLSVGGVYYRAAFFPNGWLKVQHSIQGGVYHRAAFIIGNTESGTVFPESFFCFKQSLILAVKQCVQEIVLSVKRSLILAAKL